MQIIACYGVGTDAIDPAAARDHQVQVTNTPDGLTEDVADPGTDHQQRLDVGDHAAAEIVGLYRLDALATGNVELVGEGTVAEASSVAAGRRATEALLKAHPDIDAICSPTMAMFGFNGLDLGEALPQAALDHLTFRYDVGCRLIQGTTS